MNELTIPKDEQPIVMRSGLTHWVKKETADRIRAVLAQQNGHTFLNISELGVTINTADVSGVYTTAEYEDLAKVKQGMYQCAFKNWHGKREECQCRQESEKRAREEHRRRTEANDNAPLTPEERAEAGKAIARNREILVQKGILKDKFHTGYTLKRSALNRYKKTHGNAYRVPPGAEIIEDEPLPEATNTTP